MPPACERRAVNLQCHALTAPAVVEAQPPARYQAYFRLRLWVAERVEREQQVLLVVGDAAPASHAALLTVPSHLSTDGCAHDITPHGRGRRLRGRGTAPRCGASARTASDSRGPRLSSVADGAALETRHSR